MKKLAVGVQRCRTQRLQVFLIPIKNCRALGATAAMAMAAMMPETSYGMRSRNRGSKRDAVVSNAYRHQS